MLCLTIFQRDAGAEGGYASAPTRRRLPVFQQLLHRRIARSERGGTQRTELMNVAITPESILQLFRKPDTPDADLLTGTEIDEMTSSGTLGRTTRGKRHKLATSHTAPTAGVHSAKDEAGRDLSHGNGLPVVPPSLPTISARAVASKHWDNCATSGRAAFPNPDDHNVAVLQTENYHLPVVGDVRDLQIGVPSLAPSYDHVYLSKNTNSPNTDGFHVGTSNSQRCLVGGISATTGCPKLCPRSILHKSETSSLQTDNTGAAQSEFAPLLGNGTASRTPESSSETSCSKTETAGAAESGTSQHRNRAPSVSASKLKPSFSSQNDYIGAAQGERSSGTPTTTASKLTFSSGTDNTGKARSSRSQRSSGTSSCDTIRSYLSLIHI